MSGDSISGQVIGPDGTPVQGAVVKIVQQDPPPAETKVARQTTNSQGEYFFDETDVRGKGPWHVTARYEDNGQLYHDFSKPYIDADLLEEQAEAVNVDLLLDVSLTEDAVAAIPDSGVSRWTFDDGDTESGTALDSWGSNDATLNEVTTGVSGANQTYDTAEAHSYDGADDDAIAGEAAVSSFPFTMSIWVKTSTDGAVLMIDNASNSQEETGIRIINDQFVWFNYASSANTLGGSSSVTDNSWNHLIIAVSASQAVGYLNGSEDWSTSHSENFPSGLDSTIFGILRQNDDADRYTGDLDDARIYDKQLSSTEASDLYQTGSISG